MIGRYGMVTYKAMVNWMRKLMPNNWHFTLAVVGRSYGWDDRPGKHISTKRLDIIVDVRFVGKNYRRDGGNAFAFVEDVWLSDSVVCHNFVVQMAPWYFLYKDKNAWRIILIHELAHIVHNRKMMQEEGGHLLEGSRRKVVLRKGYRRHGREFRKWREALVRRAIRRGLYVPFEDDMRLQGDGKEGGDFQIWKRMKAENQS